MTDRALSRLAWYVMGLVVLSFGAAAVLEWINAPLPSTGWGEGSLSDVLFPITMFTFPLVGCLIAARHPRNAIGWTMLGIGLVTGVTGALDGYIRYALVTQPGSLPYADVGLAVSAGSWVLVIGPIGTFTILLFPDGKLPSRRWRPVAWVATIAIFGTFLLILVSPGDFTDLGYPTVRNPLGIESLGPIFDRVLGFLLLIPISMVGSAAALVYRFRRSRGQQRLQLKWLTTAASVVAGVYAAAMLGTIATESFVTEPPTWVGWLQQSTTISFILIPTAIGIAILRHRLYNIDRIINRTLVYGSLTGILTLAYLGLVTLLQGVARPLTGDSKIAIAMSTLAVAALFRPARDWLQGLIDRHFYRKKYDAQRTLESFGATIRNEVELGSLTPALVRVVAETMQPTHASLWLRSPPRSD